MPLAPGPAVCWRHVSLTKQPYGPVHVALGRPRDSRAYWCVVSDAPTEFKTGAAYARRCDIEANCLDDTSHGFQLESSLIRSAEA